MGVSLDKVAEQAPGLVSLVKQASTTIAANGLDGTVAKVALVLDYSGSMHSEYASGAMQRLAEKVLALGLNLDDDGSIDFFVFDKDARYLGEIGLSDYQGSVQRLTRGRSMGSTDYAAAFRAVREHFFPQVKRSLFGRQKAAAPAMPVYALFLTDGVPNSQSDATAALKDLSGLPVFWKFLSIGSQSIPFLEKLDDMHGRVVDNADYQPVGDVDKIADDTLYNLMLTEYADWLAAVRNKGMIV